MIIVNTYFKRKSEHHEYKIYKITKVLLFGFFPLFIKKVEVK
jgi:hypothetical protein